MLKICVKDVSNELRRRTRRRRGEEGEEEEDGEEEESSRQVEVVVSLEVKNSTKDWAVVAPIFNPSTWEVDLCESVTRPAWSTE